MDALDALGPPDFIRGRLRGKCGGIHSARAHSLVGRPASAASVRSTEITVRSTESTEYGVRSVRVVAAREENSGKGWGVEGVRCGRRDCTGYCKPTGCVVRSDWGVLDYAYAPGGGPDAATRRARR